MKKVLTILGFIFLVINIFSVQLSDGLNDLHNPQFREDPPPSPTTPQIPAITAQEVTEYPVFSWNETTGELTSYKFYLGTDGSGETSPTNLVAGLDVGNNLSYYPDIELTLDQTYYWQVVPTHSENGDAIDCPIWSFKTKTEASEAVPYRQFFESSNNFTGDLTTTTNGGTQSTGGLISSALYGNMVSSNSFGPITDESQLVFYYRLTNYQLLGAVSPNEDLLTTFISYDNINYEAIHHLSMYEPSLNDQYKKITIDLDNYQGAYYIKIYYNIYSFSDSFLGIGPNIYFDNFFVREANLQTNLDVSPSTWNAGEIDKNSTTSQEVTITNLSTYEVFIENLSVYYSPIAPTYFSMTNSQSSFSLPEGYRQTFTVNYSPLNYGNHSTYITYEVNLEGGAAADPTIVLMTLYGSCPNPNICTYPYIQDFEERPFVNWNLSDHGTHVDSDGNHSISIQSYSMPFAFTPIHTPKFDLNEQTRVQLTLRKINPPFINQPIIISLIVRDYQTLVEENIYSTASDNPIIHYDNNILINTENIVLIILPQSYANHTVDFYFDIMNNVDDSILIDDFKVVSGWNIIIPPALEEPEVEVRQESGYPVLHWDHIDFADNYLIEASDDLSTNIWTPLTPTPYQGFVYTGDEKYKFFRVKATMSED